MQDAQVPHWMFKICTKKFHRQDLHKMCVRPGFSLVNAQDLCMICARSTSSTNAQDFCKILVLLSDFGLLSDLTSVRAQALLKCKLRNKRSYHVSCFSYSDTGI